MGSSKYSARDFQNSPPFKRSACFYVTISAIFERFQYLTLKQIFWKTKFFPQKLEYRFLFESTMIENAPFPYKTAVPEANIKTNRKVSTNWTNRKERSNYFIFLKIWFQFENLL